MVISIHRQPIYVQIKYDVMLRLFICFFFILSMLLPSWTWQWAHKNQIFVLLAPNFLPNVVILCHDSRWHVPSGACFDAHTSIKTGKLHQSITHIYTHDLYITLRCYTITEMKQEYCKSCTPQSKVCYPIMLCFMTYNYRTSFK